MNLDEVDRQQIALAFGVDGSHKMSAQEVSNMRDAMKGVSPYFVLFTARSGSTFLTYELKQTNVLSTPDELFSADYIAEVVRDNGYSPSEYIMAIVEFYKSRNGVFGAQFTYRQIRALLNIVPILDVFSIRVCWFFLRRRNVVAQAISHYIASETQLYHSYQLKEGEGSTVSVEYNPDIIKHHIASIIDEELRITDWLSSLRVLPVPLYYEDVTRNPKHATMLMSNVLRVSVPESYWMASEENPIRKLATELNLEFELAFRREEGVFLNKVLEVRPELSMVMKST